MDIINFFVIHPVFFLLVIGIFSLIIGSFLNVVIYRLPRMMQNEWGQECRHYLGLKSQADDSENLNLWWPRSHCPQCKKILKPWHNIPIISYFSLRGRCAFCTAKISLRYPSVELICCLASLYIAWYFGISWQTAGGLVFTWIILALTFIDLDYHLLPDQLTLLLVWIGLFLSIYAVFTTSHDAIIGALAGYLIFAIIQWFFKITTGKIGMGQGDYKFLAGLGAFLGWQQLPLIIFLASLIGLLFGISQMLIRHQFKSIPFPFGPSLALAGWISLIWGSQILSIYTHYFLG